MQIDIRDFVLILEHLPKLYSIIDNNKNTQ